MRRAYRLAWRIGLIAGLIRTLSLSPPTARAEEALRAFHHTRDVRALVAWGGAYWTATQGGIERFDERTLSRTHHLASNEGLDSVDVLSLAVIDGALTARTRNAVCRVSELGAQCEAAPAPPPRIPAVRGLFHGAPISAELACPQGTLLATRGAGLWLRTPGGEERALIPQDEICTEHVQAMTAFRGELWLGAFRDGLCVRRGTAFVRVEAPFRFVNALESTGDALYVAANEGLFESRDGLTFRRVTQVSERGINGLASAGSTLWVTSPAALYELSLTSGRARLRHVLRTPAGSTALQGVTVHADDVWLASEDRGALRLRAGQVEVFDALRGLDSSWVLDVAVDASGAAYVATLRHGLFRIDSAGNVHKLSTATPWLLRLRFLNDALWVGSQDGLLRGTAGQALLKGRQVHALFAWNDELWVGTETGTFVLAREGR